VESRSIAEQVAARLTPFLGSFNAGVWVKVVAKRDLGRTPDELTAQELPRLMEGLRPSLNTFMGREAAAALIDRVQHEVR
jgi:hypothetical protein